jgi:hypothetical protein
VEQDIHCRSVTEVESGNCVQGTYLHTAVVIKYVSLCMPSRCHSCFVFGGFRSLPGESYPQRDLCDFFNPSR